jgi:hypothetical protein
MICCKLREAEQKGEIDPWDIRHFMQMKSEYLVEECNGNADRTE